MLIAIGCLRDKQRTAKFRGMDIDAYIETLRSRLADCDLTREQLARVAGGEVSASWLSKFAAGHMTNPRVDTLRSLDKALATCERRVA